MNAPGATRTSLIVVLLIGLVVLSAVAVFVMQGRGTPAPSGAANGTSDATETPEGGTPEPANEPSDIASYTVRGVITSLPSEDSPDIEIQHEAIPDFKDHTGKATGMGAMNMPFPVAEGVSLEGLSVGDQVEFTFDVWWTPTSGYHLTDVRKIDE